MRRTIVFIFAVFYSLISSGAPALLHYCGHKKNVHLSVSHNNLPENSDCCHAASSTCEIDVNAAPELDDQDCCVLSEVDLDSSFFNPLKYYLLSTGCSFYNTNMCFLARAKESNTTNGPVHNNGPPLYLEFHQIIVYD